PPWGPTVDRPRGSPPPPARRSSRGAFPPSSRMGATSTRSVGGCISPSPSPPAPAGTVSPKNPWGTPAGGGGAGAPPTHLTVESFVDELAAAAKQDPVAYRRALLGKSPRGRAVLDAAAKAAGWGKPLPAGRGRGVSLQYSGWDTYLAQIAEVEVSKAGEIR